MTKTINVKCSLEQFEDKVSGKEITYVKLTADVMNVTIRLKPYDFTTAQLLKTYLTSSK